MDRWRWVVEAAQDPATVPNSAQTITAVSALLTAVSLIIVAVAGLIPLLRRTKRIETAAMEIHVMVNQQRTNLVNYQSALLRAMTAAGVTIPEDQSAAAPPTESEKTP